MGAFSLSPECMEGEFCEGSHAEDSTKPWSEHFPTEVGVDALVKDVRVKGERFVVGEGELHAAHDGVQALGLGPPVLLVHQVGVVDDLRDLVEHSVLQLVLLQESLEGAVPQRCESLAPTTSRSSAPSGASVGSPKKAKAASGSKKRRINQMQAVRSTWQPRRVAHSISPCPPRHRGFRPTPHGPSRLRERP